MTKVINFYGAPGSGKSTMAAELFVRLKREYRDVKVELVREYAKELEYLGVLKSTSQWGIYDEQERREQMLLNKVDYIITDSPLPLPHFYTSLSHNNFGHQGVVFFESNRINILVHRELEYQPYGRSQTEGESDYIQLKIQEWAKNNGIEFHIQVKGKDGEVDKVIDTLKDKGLLNAK